MDDERVDGNDLWAKLDEAYERFVDEHIVSDPRLEEIVHNILILPLIAAEASHQGIPMPSRPEELRALLNEQAEKLSSQGLDPLSPAIVVLLTQELPEGVTFPEEIEGIRIYAELPVPTSKQGCYGNCGSDNSDCCKDGSRGGDCACDHRETNPI